MSAWRWAELTCDGDNCGENLREREPSGSFEEVRREAKQAGWQRVKVGDAFQDRCPDCVTCVVADA